MPLWSLLLSAVNTALGFVFRAVLVKFVVFTALFAITAALVPVLGSMLPNSQGLSGALGGIPSGVWYMLDLFNFSTGFPVIVSAYVTRFIIRRIPVIG